MQYRNSSFSAMQTIQVAILATWALLLLNGQPGESKQYMRCELTRVMVERYNFDKSLMSNWICLVEHESFLDTRKVTHNENNSKSYGLFQINNRDYCAEGRKGGICDIKCEDLSNDDISDDLVCAKIIQARDGFKYWKGWTRFCRNAQNRPNLNVACNLPALSPLIKG